jgi:predicted MFS family arabinose efflux permease
MLANHTDWSGLWFVSGAISFAAALGVAFLVPPEDAAAPAAAPAESHASKGFVPLIAAYCLFGFGYVITATFLMVLVRGAPSLAPLEPYAWIFVGLSAAPSTILWNWVAGRWGILKGFAAAAVVEAIGVALSVLFLSTTAIVLAAVLLGGTFMGLTALGLIAARAAGTGDPRARLGLMTASFSAGQIVGPAFAGYVFDVTGSLTAPSLTAAVALLIAAALALVADNRR